MDVFALGIMLGYLLIGHLPSDDADVARTLTFDQGGGGGGGCCGGGGGGDVLEPRLIRDVSEVDEDAADLWRRMTLPEVDDRIDVAQAMRHQWFAPRDEDPPESTTAAAPGSAPSPTQTV